MKLFGIVASVALAALATSVPGATQAATAQSASPRQRGVADPVAYVRSVYRSYRENGDAPDASYGYSPELRRLLAADRAAWSRGEGVLDVDFWTGMSDTMTISANVREEPRSNGRRIILARFRTAGPQLFRFYFVQIRGRWFLDDVESIGSNPEGRWRLRALLAQQRRQ